MRLRTAALLLLALFPPATQAHEETRSAFVPPFFAAANRGDEAAATDESTGSVVLRTHDPATGAALPANVRIHALRSGSPVAIEELTGRPLGWHAQAGPTRLALPPGQYTAEAFLGIATERASARFEVVAGAPELEVDLPLVTIDALAGWQSANTHLHLGETSVEQAKAYLRLVGATDGLDFVWVSHLERRGADHAYVTNRLDADAVHRLRTERTRFGWGQEHRHNFPPNLNGYGHALLLEIPGLIEPVSVGRVLAGDASDGVPLRAAMARARELGGTVLWAHNDAGYEDLPSWLDGLVDVQNVWDGGSGLGLERSLYRYLDLGLEVPLASGTDWWVRSLGRVLVHLPTAPTRERFLEALRAGRSMVTTGPMIDLQVAGRGPGEKIERAEAGTLPVRAAVRGRARFDTLELLVNGEVIERALAVEVGGHFEAVIEQEVRVEASSWLAARVPEAEGPAEFGGPLLAHTSAVAVVIGGKPRFEANVARELALEMDWNRREIERRAVFADEAERERVTRLYRNAIASLEARMPLGDRVRSVLTRWLRALRDWFAAIF